jgi:ribosomal subunit interface protein
MLELQIKSLDFPVTGETDEYIRERAAKLDRFYPRILTVRVILEAPVGHHRQGGPFTVRIEADVPGTLLTASHEADDDLHVAIRSSFSAMERQLSAYASRQRGESKPSEGPPVGRVVRIVPDEGYGFLEAPDGHEVYFHEHSVLGGKFRDLTPGHRVRFTEEDGVRGPQASTVELE